MLDLKSIANFSMLFMIAFLVNRHILLIQDYETLKASCHEKEKCHCLYTKPITQSSIDPSAITTMVSSSSKQGQNPYWMNQDTSSEQVLYDEKPECLVSSSYPSILMLNPRETGSFNTQISEMEPKESGYGEGKTLSIPETDASATTDNIPAIQPSDKTFLHIKQDFINPSFDSSLSHESNELDFSLLTSFSSTQNGKESTSEEIKDFYFNLPVQQTHTILSANDHKNQQIESQIENPLQTSLDKDEGVRPQNRNVLRTSMSSNIRHATLGIRSHTMPSQTLSNLLTDDDVTPLSTDAPFVLNKDDKHLDELHHDCNSDYAISPNNPSSFYYKNNLEDNDMKKSSKVIDNIFSSKDKVSLAGGSSAKCSGTNPGKKHCFFNNICYNALKNDFIFFKGHDSVIESDPTQNIAEVFSSLSLSTLSEHNALMFSIVTLPIEAISSFSISVINKKSIAITRFKPDNIMHVLHDDILPLHHTLHKFNFDATHNGPFDVVLVFTDSFDESDYSDFYSSLSIHEPLLLKEFNRSQQLICFSEIHIGLLTSTVWYQYGFFKPQGPLPLTDNLISTYIQDTTKFLIKSFHTDCFLCKQKDYVLLLSRKDNRLILNEGELIMALSQSTRLKVFSVSLETHSLAEIITMVKSSQGLIGMHGSLLAVSLFLPPGGVVIELFPFGVNPAHYVPFKSLSELPGSRMIYKSWANPDKSKSIAHPNLEPKEGGIQHLSPEMQKEIKLQTEVPEHLCCNDPSWLYHIYQDTYVNISAVVSLTKEALQTQSSMISHKESSALLPDIPGAVEDLRCEMSNSDQATDKNHKAFKVSWIPHWSLNYFPFRQKLRYEIVLQEEGSVYSSTSTLEMDFISYSFDSFSNSQTATYNVWITVIVSDNTIRSQSKHTYCLTDV